MYAGIRGNIGNTWNKNLLEIIKDPNPQAGGSIGLAADTLFGEVHLRFALATGEKPTRDALRYAVYLVLGNGSFTP